jgi:glucose repression regulatory protein TUP1
VWDIATKTIRNQFSGGEDHVMTLVYGLDGRTIAFDCSNTVQIWDIEQNKNISILHLQDSVQAIAISDDIQFVAAGSTNGSISLWSVVTGSLITTLEGPDGHNEPICSMNFSSNAQGLVSSSFDGTIKMWDLQGIHSGKEGNEYIRTLETGHTSPVQSVTLTPDARFVLSGSDDSRVQFWDAENGKAQLMLQGHSQTIYSVASSPQGGYFATGSGDRTARIWSYSPYKTPTERSI